MYDPLAMFDSKRDVADLLNEYAEKKSVREFLRQQKPQAHELQSKGKYSRER